MTTAPHADGDVQPRLAFFISSYRSNAQLGRLLRTLRAAQPDAQLLVFHDVYGCEIDPSVVAEVGGELFTSPDPVVWGDFALDRVRLRVMRWAVEHTDFDWLVLLSEQDYPIAPLDDLARRLAASGADAVIDTEPIEEIASAAQRRDCHWRYDYRRRSLPAWQLTARWPAPVRNALATVRELAWSAFARTQPWVHVYPLPRGLGLPSQLGVRRHLPADVQVWWGSAWFALSRRGTQRLVELADASPEVVDHYEHSIIPVESLAHTLLANAPDVRIERESLHHIRWSDRGSGRPDVFTEADLPELAASGRFFARKFDEDDPVLDRLDELVLVRTQTPQEGQVA